MAATPPPDDPSMMSADEGVSELLKELQGGGLGGDRDPDEWAPERGIANDIGLGGCTVSELLEGIRMMQVESPDSLHNMRKALHAVERQVQAVKPPQDALGKISTPGPSCAAFDAAASPPPSPTHAATLTALTKERIKEDLSPRPNPTPGKFPVLLSGPKPNPQLPALLHRKVASVLKETTQSTHTARSPKLKLYTQTGKIAVAGQHAVLDVVQDEQLQMLEEKQRKVLKDAPCSPQAQERSCEHRIVVEQHPQEVKIISGRDRLVESNEVLVSVMQSVAATLEKITERPVSQAVANHGVPSHHHAPVEMKQAPRHDPQPQPHPLRPLKSLAHIQGRKNALKTLSTYFRKLSHHAAASISRRANGRTLANISGVLRLETLRRLLRTYFTKFVRWTGWRRVLLNKRRANMRKSGVLLRATVRTVLTGYYHKLKAWRRKKAVLQPSGHLQPKVDSTTNVNPVQLGRHVTAPVKHPKGVILRRAGHGLLEGVTVTKPRTVGDWGTAGEEEEEQALREKREVARKQCKDELPVRAVRRSPAPAVIHDHVVEALSQEVLTRLVRIQLNATEPLLSVADQPNDLPPSHGLTNLAIRTYVAHHNSVQPTEATLHTRDTTRSVARSVLSQYIASKMVPQVHNAANKAAICGALCAAAAHCGTPEITDASEVNDTPSGGTVGMDKSAIEKYVAGMFETWTQGQRVMRLCELEERARRAEVEAEVCEFYEFLSRLLLYKEQQGRAATLRLTYLLETENVFRRNLVLQYARDWDRIWSRFITQTTAVLLRLSMMAEKQLYKAHFGASPAEHIDKVPTSHSPPASIRTMTKPPTPRCVEEEHVHVRVEDTVYREEVRLNLRAEDAPQVAEEMKVNLRAEDPPCAIEEDIPLRGVPVAFPVSPPPHQPDPRVTRLVTDWFQSLESGSTSATRSTRSTRTLPPNICNARPPGLVPHSPARAPSVSETRTTMTPKGDDSETTMSGTTYSTLRQ